MSMVYSKTPTSIPKSVTLIFKIRIFSKIVRHACRMPGACVLYSWIMFSVWRVQNVNGKMTHCGLSEICELAIYRISCSSQNCIFHTPGYMQHSPFISQTVVLSCSSSPPPTPFLFFCFEKQNLFVEGKDGVGILFLFLPLQRPSFLSSPVAPSGEGRTVKY